MEAITITKDTRIADVVENFPQAVEVLFDAGLGCVGCPMSMHETIEQGCMTHGFDEEDMNLIIMDLNSLIKSLEVKNG